MYINIFIKLGGVIMKTDLRQLFQIRIGIYNVLRHFFYYGPCDDNVRELNNLIENKEITVETLEELSEEYTRLFIGPNQVPISLYESAFRQPGTLLMQDTTANVRNQYLASAMVADGIINLPEDHLAIELEFIYALAKESLQILENNNNLPIFLQNLEQQRKFIQDRTDWIEAIVRKVDEYSQNRGINEVFYLLKDVVQDDLSFINNIIEENAIYYESEQAH